MNRELPIYLPIKAVLLILVQAFIFSKMALFGFISPMIYSILLYIYPTHKNRSLWITWAFLFGLSLDILLDTLALHAIVLLFMAYIRPKIMRVMFGLNFEQKSFRIQQAPVAQRYTFIAAIILLHHLVYFSLEAFSWSKWLLVIEKTFSTGIVSFIFSLLLINLLTTRKK
jgi:rod shape-determining protein MreD